MSKEEVKKKKTGLLKTLLIGFLVWVFVKIIFTFLGGAANRVDETLPPTAMESYLEGCVSSGGSETYCVCTKDYLLDNYGGGVFAEPISDVLKKSQEARANCTN